MRSTLRQSMAWLHTWCGLTCGWLLCGIFLAGTLSVFREPITRWMEAPPVLPAAQAVDLASLPQVQAKAVEYLAQQADGARFWRVQFAQYPGDAIRLAWRSAHGGQGEALLDPRSAEVMPEPQVRATEGGRHFMSFHYMLQWGTAGYWLVGWVSMCMLVALVCGVIIHRRLFQDFFTFRPGKSARAWLDLHNATAVLALPFHFMIVYTGLAIFYTSYLPWPLQTAYGADAQAYTRFAGELAGEPAPIAPRQALGGAAVLPDLPALTAQAHRLMGQPVAMLLLEQPGTDRMRVRFWGQQAVAPRTDAIVNKAATVTFDGVTGALLQVSRPDTHRPGPGEQVHSVMESLHLVHFGGWTAKWLYFLCGLLGTLMVVAGNLLFMVKRRRKGANEFGALTPGIYRAIEALNVTAVAGSAVACIAYFYANRLLPVELAARADWEIRAFGLAWLAMLLHALCRRPARAWVEQLGLAALLCLGLPLLNYLSTGQQFFAYVLADDWQRAGVEGVTVGLGAALSSAAWRLSRKGTA